MCESREEIINFDKPLKFGEMKDMVGEPVWNADLKKWMLVEKVTDGYVRMKSVNDVYLYHDFQPEDFKKSKMYRMKVWSNESLEKRMIQVLREIRGEI